MAELSAMEKFGVCFSQHPFVCACVCVRMRALVCMCVYVGDVCGGCVCRGTPRQRADHSVPSKLSLRARRDC